MSDKKTSETDLLRKLIRGKTVTSAPVKTERHGEWVEFIFGIGNDEVAYLTMPKEALDLLFEYKV